MNVYVAIGLLMILATICAGLLIAFVTAGAQSVIDHYMAAKTVRKVAERDGIGS